MKTITKLNKALPTLNDVLICINENKPKEKKKEYSKQEFDNNNILKCITYTIEDKKGAKHIFTVTPEVNDGFRIVYVSDGEYQDYVADDLDSLF